MKKSILGILALLGTVTILILIAWIWIPDSFEEKYEFTLGYVCFQIIVGGIAFGVLSKWKLWYTHTNTVASILTVIGVFGTFLGIFVGLLVFDITNIEQSIPGLLEGLQLAFLTSLVGIGSAILLKGVVAPLFQVFQKGKNPIELERDKFIHALKGIETSGEINLRAQLVTLNKTIKKEGSETREVLDNIKTDLAGKHLDICKNCLWKELNLWHISPNAFPLTDWFNAIDPSYQPPPIDTLYGPKTTPVTGPISNYPPDWNLKSLQCQEKARWKCEECGIDLRLNRKFLHAHHLKGTQYNQPEDLKALCVGCHAEQPRHEMKHLPDYLEFMDKYGSLWKQLVGK